MSSNHKTPPTPTISWALEHAERYLRGDLTVFEFYEPFVDLLEQYNRIYPNPGDERGDVVYDFCADGWGRSSRVLRGLNSEEDLRNLLTEWLPDLRAEAVRSRRDAGP